MKNMITIETGRVTRGSSLGDLLIALVVTVALIGGVLLYGYLSGSWCPQEGYIPTERGCEPAWFNDV